MLSAWIVSGESSSTLSAVANWIALFTVIPAATSTVPANEIDASRLGPGSTRAMASRTLAPNHTSAPAAYAPTIAAAT
jgi:hypothetical protein